MNDTETMMNDPSCPVCKTPNSRRHQETMGGYDIFDDETCGRYMISGSALSVIRKNDDFIEKEDKRKNLILLVKKNSKIGKIITTTDLIEIGIGQ